MKRMKLFLKSTDGFCTNWRFVFTIVIAITAIFVLYICGVIPL